MTPLSSAQLWHCFLPMPPLPLESTKQSVSFYVFKEEMLEVKKKKVLWGICEILGAPLPFSLCTNSPSWQRYPALMKNGSEDSSLEMTIARLVPREERIQQILSSLSPFQLSTQTTWNSLHLSKASELPQLLGSFNVYAIILPNSLIKSFIHMD